jgi:XTP/dITP diphosphohydrolase
MQSLRADNLRLRRGEKLVVATHNRGKLAEIGALLTPFAIELSAATSFGLAAPDETAVDFVGNAQIKARAAAAATGLAALADDSGFCVAALGGAPGLFSARWAEAEGGFAGGMRKVAALAGAHVDRRAWFVCALCLALPDGTSASFLGRVDGAWIWPARGAQGFGYDPMFVPIGGTLSYGEMSRAEKEADSHRARAFAQLVAACLPRRDAAG